MGRPSKFTLKAADGICERLAGGESLRTICASESMPPMATVFRWLAAHRSFREQYARAREAQADALADEILNIADDSTGDTYTDDDGVEHTNHEVVARSKLRVDARKWLAAKLRPKVYGEKLQQELSGPNGGPIAQISMSNRQFEEIARNLLAEV
jgi:hypothetical protein